MDRGGSDALQIYLNLYPQQSYKEKGKDGLLAAEMLSTYAGVHEIYIQLH